MKRTLTKAFSDAFFSDGLALVLLVAFCWVESGGNHPDASENRTTLYVLFFLIIPTVFAALISAAA
jgi:hypothetical protein